MKKMRSAVVLLAMFVGSALGTGPAFAQELYPPEPTVIETATEAAPVAPGLAVTGGNITVGLLILVGFLLAGTAALLAGRRRARAQA